jgi:hypothetical protein
MMRLVCLVALSCCISQDEDAEVLPSVVHTECQLTERLESTEKLLWATRQEVSQLRTDLDDARLLTLVGGPRMRWRGGGVTCDGGNYLPGSWGEAAHRALRQTGYCDPARPTAVSQ